MASQKEKGENRAKIVCKIISEKCQKQMKDIILQINKVQSQVSKKKTTHRHNILNCSKRKLRKKNLNSHGGCAGRDWKNVH